MYLVEIYGAITAFIETSDSIIVIWEGSILELDMTERCDLKKDQHYYTTSVLLDNTGLDPFTDLYYYRNIEPDNNQTIDGGWHTQNTVESQSEMADDSVRVSATQDEPWLSEIILHAYGPNWKGFIGGFINRDASDMWNGDGPGWDPPNITEGASEFADKAFGIAYKVGILPPGKVASEWFSFATAFKRDIVFEEEEEPDTDELDENSINFRIYPNPNETGNLNIALIGQFKYQITDINGRLILMGSGADNVEIDLTQVENGIYFITLEQNEITKTEKLIVR